MKSIKRIHHIIAMVGFQGSVLLSGDPAGTKELLTNIMGLKRLDVADGNHH